MHNKLFRSIAWLEAPNSMFIINSSVPVMHMDIFIGNSIWYCCYFILQCVPTLFGASWIQLIIFVCCRFQWVVSVCNNATTNRNVCAEQLSGLIPLKNRYMLQRHFANSRQAWSPRDCWTCNCAFKHLISIDNALQMSMYRTIEDIVRCASSIKIPLCPEYSYFFICFAFCFLRCLCYCASVSFWPFLRHYSRFCDLIQWASSSIGSIGSISSHRITTT